MCRPILILPFFLLLFRAFLNVDVNPIFSSVVPQGWPLAVNTSLYVFLVLFSLPLLQLCLFPCKHGRPYFCPMLMQLSTVNENPGTQLTWSNKFCIVTLSCLLQSNVTTPPRPQTALRSIPQVLTPHPLSHDIFCAVNKIPLLGDLPRSKTNYDKIEPASFPSKPHFSLSAVIKGHPYPPGHEQQLWSPLQSFFSHLLPRSITSSANSSFLIWGVHVFIPPPLCFLAKWQPPALILGPYKQMSLLPDGPDPTTHHTGTADTSGP